MCLMSCTTSVGNMFNRFVDNAVYPVPEDSTGRVFATYDIAGVECLISRRDDATCWVLYSHGNAVTLNDLYYEGIANGMVENCRCNFVAPAYPSRLEYGVKYDEVVSASVRAVYERICTDTNEPVYLAGRSLGVGIALQACASVSTAPAGLICVSGFTCMRDMVPRNLSMFSCMVQDRYNNCAAICGDGIDHVSKLIIHGSADDMVPVSHALQLCEAANNVELKIIDSMGHCPDEHWNEVYSHVASFIKETNPLAASTHHYPAWRGPI